MTGPGLPGEAAPLRYEPPLRYEEWPPPAALAPYVQTCWAFSVVGPATLHHIPPDGCLSLVVMSDGPGLALSGPQLTARPIPVHPGEWFRGVRMRPEAAGLLAGVLPAAWRGRGGPLAEAAPTVATPLLAALNGKNDEAAFARLLDALAVRAATLPPPDALVGAAVDAIERHVATAAAELRVDALAAELGVSARTLQRRFAAVAGVSPKAYARVRRFRLALSNLLRATPDAWGRVAAELGFADQAHLTRECAAFMGLPPTAVSPHTRRIEHVGVTP